MKNLTYFFIFQNGQVL